MPKPNSTEIIVVLDRSGSMANIQTDMCGGFDQFIKDQRALPGEASVTLAQFDDVWEIVYEGKPLADVPSLILVPRGGTALYDAVGRTISERGARLVALPEEQRPERVLFVIITDGGENSSKEFNADRVKAMVALQSGTYSWRFVYLGANQDAFLVGGQMGIGTSSNYVADAAGTKGMFAGVSSNTAIYRGGGNYGTP